MYAILQYVLKLYVPEHDKQVPKVNAILELNHGTDEHEYAKLEKCSALNEDIKKITV